MRYLLLIITGVLLFVQSHAQMQGRVIDAQTGEVLPGVTVQLLHADKGCQTDATGRFVLNGSKADDSVKVSFVGYQSQKLTIKTQPLIVSLTPATASLNEIIVTTSRDKQSRTDAPVAISTISTQEIRDTKATSLEQLLNKVSGVYMVDLGNEQHTMAIRQPIGYKSLFLYLEDGIPIRTIGDFNHNALIEINQAALRNIEVVRGPASSLYGSEAVGGAVNFITAAPSLKPMARIQAEISDRGYKRTDFSASSTFNKVGIVFGGYYADQRNGYMDHSDFHKLAFTLRADYQINERTKWINSATLTDYYTDQVGGLDSAHFYSKDYRNFQTFSYRKVNAFRYRSTLEHAWSTTNRTTVTAFFRNNSIGQNPFYAIKNNLQDPLKATGEINDDSFNSYGLIIQHKKQFPWRHASLIAGVSADYSPATYYSEFIDIDRSAAGYYTGYTKSDSLLTDYNVGLLNTAAYAQFDMELLRNLKLVAALRYDRMDYDFDNHLTPSAFTGAPDERNNFNALTPKVGLTYDFGKSRGLYANYSVGFAPPNISELYRGVKVPTLEPATYRNYEAGGWFGFANDKGYVDIGVYNMQGTNEIISVKLDDGSYENRNAGRTTHRGIEWNVRYAPVRSLWIRCSGQYAEHFFNEYIEKGVSYDDNQMSGAPKVITNTEITWKPAFLHGFRLGGEWQHVSRYYMDPQNTRYYGGYDLLNFRTGYNWRNLECWLNCRNAADAIYATTAEKTTYSTTYRPGPKRTFNIGVAYTFNGKN